MIFQEAEEEIRKAALKNALDYGSARTDSVISKILSRFPELKAEIKSLSVHVKKIVDEINKLDRKEIEREAARYSEEFEIKRQEKIEKTSKPKMILEGAVSGLFYTRFPPNPNGRMHIGHAKVAFMESEFAKIYAGGLALYFDDTNPDVAKQEFVEKFKEDLEWLGLKFDAEYYASDSIEITYGYAESLVKNGDAYVCSCTPDKIKENRANGIACEHKKQSREKNKAQWKEMIEGAVADNTMVLRLNSDIKAANTAIRDPTLFRIKHMEHYRQKKKYVVWPTYDFNTPIVDSIKGITDVIRSKEYELRDELYIRILGLLSLRRPRLHSIARLEIENNLTSKTEINRLIREGLLWGYDDPRLVTIAGLKRRGITPAAIKEFVLRFGMSKADSKVKIEMLLAENRKKIDREAKRFFFLDSPVKLKVKGIPKNLTSVEIRLHPLLDLGYRRYKLNDIFFINASDTIDLREGSEIRLKDAFNIKVEKITGDQIEAVFAGNVAIPAQKVQWINEGNYIGCKVYSIGELLKDDQFNKESLKIVNGYVESYATKIKEGEAVQFERYGFFKLDDKKERAFISL